jgi:hypothetical protein
MEAPVNKIRRIAYDLYLILEYKDDQVTIFKSAKTAMRYQKHLRLITFTLAHPGPRI